MDVPITVSIKCFLLETTYQVRQKINRILVFYVVELYYNLKYLTVHLYYCVTAEHTLDRESSSLTKIFT